MYDNLDECLMTTWLVELTVNGVRKRIGIQIYELGLRSSG